MLTAQLFDGLAEEVVSRIRLVCEMAVVRRHTTVTADHLFCYLLDDPSLVKELQAREVATEEVKQALTAWLLKNTQQKAGKGPVVLAPALNFERVINRAKGNLKSLGEPRPVAPIDVLVAMMDEKNSISIEYLKKKGLNKEKMKELRGRVPPNHYHVTKDWD